MSHFRLSFRGPAWLCVAILLLSACGGGGGGSSSPVPAASPGAAGGSGSPAPAASPTGSPVGIRPITQPTVAPSPGSSPIANTAAYTCPTSDTATAAVRGRMTAADGVRRSPARHTGTAPAAATQLLAVTYDAQTASAQRTALSARESALGTSLVRQFTFAHTNLVTRVLRVSTAQLSRTEAALRVQAGVRSVGLTGARRYKTAVTTPYLPNDPYFDGFSPTVAPLRESATVPGQWDMHVTRLEYAFGYSQANNGSSITNPAALGSAGVKIAVIDTGQDTTHPELAWKIAYQHCYITDPKRESFDIRVYHR